MDIADVEIPRADIRSVNFSPSKELAMDLLAGPISTESGRVVRNYVMTFSNIQRAHIKVEPNPWLEVFEFNVEADGAYAFLLDEGEFRIWAESAFKRITRRNAIQSKAVMRF